MINMILDSLGKSIRELYLVEGFNLKEKTLSEIDIEKIKEVQETLLEIKLKYK